MVIHMKLYDGCDEFLFVSYAQEDLSTVESILKELYRRNLRIRYNNGNTSVPEFMSTHPSDATRINDIKKYFPELEKYKAK